MQMNYCYFFLLKVFLIADKDEIEQCILDNAVISRQIRSDKVQHSKMRYDKIWTWVVSPSHRTKCGAQVSC